ncbi:MAG: hypothetical protein OMM_01233 [Candidatus Magnetoglobus multicellularis str. Araruama]|uniref:Uncharacterized protein n=1 Tax=Candidatus Magnetoglobus multicellularis str. Araruama TaxID=890399 RepID=A0A1V1PEH8_9BACT|nr:MAG: hypothetical protein OMM_01233 [Candidatus Magnetoglobus multicellularis str. Araruama]
MKKLHLTVFIMCLTAQFAWAGVLGDIDRDNAIGLPEAIYALQVTSGMETNSENRVVDFQNYFFSDGTEFFYKTISFDTTSGSQVIDYIYAYHLAKELNNQPTMIECWYNPATYQEYYSIQDSNSRYLMAGDYWNGYYADTIQIGAKYMTVGDVFSSVYQINNFPYWCEYKCLGFEDVEIQAGTFNDCLQMSKVFSSQWGVLFSYYYAGIGLVKQIYASSQDSFTMELIACRTNSTTYPSNLEIKRYYGTWTNTGTEATDGFSFFYLPQNDGMGILILANFPTLYQNQTISLVSTDGTTFSPVNSSYNVSATVTNQSFGGTYTYSYWNDDAQEYQNVDIRLSPSK